MGGMSSFDLTVVIAELNGIIKGSRINKIYQVNPKTVLMKLRGQGETSNLLIESGRRIHLTVYEVERPREPPSFCMALRKYLENGVIEDISQYDLERIIELHVKRGDQRYRLIVELFEKGNIILVDPENRILHALSYRKMKDRSILRGEEYKYPPQRGIDPRKAELEDFYRLRNFGEIESVRGLTRLLGISGSYAEEILFRSSVDKTKPCSSLSDEEIKAIYSSMNEILYEIINAGGYKPCIIVDGNNNWVNVVPFPLKKYSKFSVIEMETFNRALDEYYMKITYQERARSIEEKARQKMRRMEKVLEEQRRNLMELEEDARTYRKIGDTIYNHLHELNLLIERVMHEKRSGRGWEDIARELLEKKERGIVPSTYFVSLNPSALTLKVSVNGQLFDLSLKASAQESATEYYERAKKLEDKVKGVKKAIEETIKKIEEVKSDADKSAGEVLPPRPIIRKEWYEKFRWFHSSGGFLIIGGRDASTNEVLIRKYMAEDDIVFHADIPGSPFTLIKTNRKQPDEETILEAAQFTASYSRAWKEQIGAIDVYWVKPEQVSKASPSGQYLPKGSFMIYGTRNYIRNVPLEVAIGIKREDDNIRVIGGPVSAISKQTNLYVKIVPGNAPSGRLAKAVREKLASMVPIDERKIILKIPLENIQAFIPPGQGSIA